MAQQINVVTMVGNLTSDPELRSLPSGTSVGKLRIANNRRVKVNGEWTDRVGYFDVTVWGAQAENCARYLSRGRPVCVRGELRWREWDDPNSGQKRQAVDINADEVMFLGGKEGGQQQQAQDYAPHPMQQSYPQQAPVQQGYPQGEAPTGPPPHQDPTAPVGPPQVPQPGVPQQGAYGGPPQPQGPVPDDGSDIPF